MLTSPIIKVMGVRFQVLTAASMKITVFWDVAFIALVIEAVSTCETSVASIRLQRATSQKIAIFILVAVIT
jgi:hypothetical protein